MAKGMRDLNPPCKEYIDLETLATEEDLENPASSSQSYFFGMGQEIELTSLHNVIQRNVDAIEKNGQELTWIQFIFGSTVKS